MSVPALDATSWTDPACVELLQWMLPRLRMRWKGFRKVRRQVCRRIRERARGMGFDGFAAYRAYLEATPEEWAVVDELCRVTISRFFRDRRMFETLGASVLPARARRAGRGEEVRAWSAGCGSGEEPYTLSILWSMEVSPRFPETEFGVVATDAGPVVLERAGAARYGPGTLKELPDRWIEQAFEPLRGPSGNTEHVLRPSFRRSVEFHRQDIRREMPPGPFDLVLCRNLVFTYFTEALQEKLLGRMLERMLPGGTLALGAHESLPRGSWPLAPHPDSSCLYVAERSGSRSFRPPADA